MLGQFIGRIIEVQMYIEFLNYQPVMKKNGDLFRCMQWLKQDAGASEVIIEPLQ
jgi:hypothetical protein